MRAWRTARTSSTCLEVFARRALATSAHRRHRESVASLLSHTVDAEEVTVHGWVRSLRKQKRVAFAAINDGSTVHSLQAVLNPEDAISLSNGAAIKLTGDWKPSKGSGQSHELQVSSIAVLGENDAENSPLQPKYQTVEYLRTIPHLRARIPANALLLRLRSQLIAAITNFFNREDFVQTHTPVLTSSDCEGAGEVFTVSTAPGDAHASMESSSQRQQSRTQLEQQHFFRTPKYLTVSAQLHLEALAHAVNKVWTLSPTFRAEQSDTPRHLSEFYMLEAEMCFVSDLERVMDLVENMLRSAVTDMKGSLVFNELLETRHSKANDAGVVDAETIHRRWDGLVASRWPRITYARAVNILQDAHSRGTADFAFAPSYQAGLQAEHERYIAAIVGEGKPVFVTNYPRKQKPFYMPPSKSATDVANASDTVACFDLLVPDLCELVGGSLREHRSVELLAAMREKGVVGENLEWYQDLRKYGSVPHGGFGLGFDRLLCYLAGVGNVRDVVAFPRWYGRCEC